MSTDQGNERPLPATGEEFASPVSVATSPEPVCARCGLPMTRRGGRGECLRCALRAVWEDEGDEDPSEEGTRSVLRYGHFEVSKGYDGLPVELGSGAMGTTYRATDTVLRSPVALKVISQNVASDPAARARFLREARATARLHHPNVASVTFYGEQEGECFYAMELVEGETLAERVQRAGVLSAKEAVEVGVQVARALAAAEAFGVVHRDLKPSNLMLVGTPAAGAPRQQAPALHVKVIDWGLAKAVSNADAFLGADQTRGAFVGTPAFASPEQFAGGINGEKRRVDTRSDIYSLGVTLWFLLCGKAPFVGDTLDAIHARQKSPPIEQLKAAKVPGRLARVLHSMVAFDPAARPQSARELLDIFVRYQGTSKRTALPGVWHRYQLIVGVLALLCLSGVGAVVWQKLAQHSQPLVAASDKPSLAVLPFENLSLDASDAFFATTVQDEVTNDIARIAALDVVSAESVREYPPGKRDLAKISHELGVRYLLEGSVLRQEDQVSVKIRLFDPRDAKHPWSETYTRRKDDMFTAQGEITRAVVNHLRSPLTEAEKVAIHRPPTNDLVAYDLYLRARNGGQVFESQEQEVHYRLETSIPLLDQAIKRDPRFAFAYAELSNQYVRLVAFEAASGQAEAAAMHRLQAEAALAKAVRLRPDAGEIHLAQARRFYELNSNYEEAFQELAQARRALPNNAEVENLASFLARDRNDWPEAIRCLERGVVLAPRDTDQRFTLAMFYRQMRRFAEAEFETARVVAALPRDQSLPYRTSGAVAKLEERGDLGPLRSIVKNVTAADAPSMERLIKARLILALYSHDGTTATALLADVPATGLMWGENRFPKAWFEALAARLRHDDTVAREAFGRVRTEEEHLLLINPLDGFAQSVLAMADAGLGNREKAESEAQQIFSDSKTLDAATVTAPVLACHVAVVQAWNGQADRACDTLEAWLRRPAGDGLVKQPNYGDFLLNPLWDPLRGQRRFEALVARLAPVTRQKGSPVPARKP